MRYGVKFRMIVGDPVFIWVRSGEEGLLEVQLENGWLDVYEGEDDKHTGGLAGSVNADYCLTWEYVSIEVD